MKMLSTLFIMLAGNRNAESIAQLKEAMEAGTFATKLCFYGLIVLVAVVAAVLLWKLSRQDNRIKKLESALLEKPALSADHSPDQVTNAKPA